MYILAGCTLFGWVWFQKIHFHLHFKDRQHNISSKQPEVYPYIEIFYESWVIKLRICLQCISKKKLLSN